MPDSKFTQTWHGVPREEIDWHPIVDESLCIGCGMCVTGCGRQVYGYDYDREKAIVLRPESCLVGCVTCANTCLEGAITFPPVQRIHKLIRQKKVLTRVKKQELPEGRERWAVNSQLQSAGTDEKMTPGPVVNYKLVPAGRASEGAKIVSTLATALAEEEKSA